MIDLSDRQEIWGRAWADGGVCNVYIRTDDAATWQPVELEPPHGRAWQRFSMPWTPVQRGRVGLASLVEAMSGQLQPISGRRNAIHDVPVNVI